MPIQSPGIKKDVIRNHLYGHWYSTQDKTTALNKRQEEG